MLFPMMAVCSRWKEFGVGFERTRDWISSDEALMPFCAMRGKPTYTLICRQLQLFVTNTISNPSALGVLQRQHNNERANNKNQKMEPPEFLIMCLQPGTESRLWSHSNFFNMGPAIRLSLEI